MAHATRSAPSPPPYRSTGAEGTAGPRPRPRAAPPSNPPTPSSRTPTPGGSGCCGPPTSWPWTSSPMAWTSSPTTPGSRLVPQAPEALLEVRYSFQHTLEAAEPEMQVPPPPTPVPVPARAAFGSRLVFAVAATERIEYSVEGVLAAMSRLPLVVVPLATPRAFPRRVPDLRLCRGGQIGACSRRAYGCCGPPSVWCSPPPPASGVPGTGPGPIADRDRHLAAHRPRAPGD